MPEKHRFVWFLSVTSVLGVILIFIAVYNASRELEVVHELDSMHRLARAALSGTMTGEDVHHLQELATAGYRTARWRDGALEPLVVDATGDPFPVTAEALASTRLNEFGGYLEQADADVVWVEFDLPGSADRFVLAHRFQRTPLGVLLRVYAKRLVIPAVFYVWLMVWVALVIRNLTEGLRNQKDAMEHMALHDSLSGLPNRNLLADRLRQLIQAHQRKPNKFALALMDLDRFKAVNDTYGHDHGDELLRQVAQRLRESLRASDTAARVGGDEFVLLLDDVDADAGRVMSDRLVEALSRPYEIMGSTLKIGASIGVTVFPDDGATPEALTRNADLAMYRAKATGGGVYFYTPGLRADVA